MKQEKLERLESGLGLQFSYAELLANALLDSPAGKSAESLVLLHEALLPKQEEEDKRAQTFSSLKDRYDLPDEIVNDLIDLAVEKVTGRVVEEPEVEAPVENNAEGATSTVAEGVPVEQAAVVAEEKQNG